MRYLPATHPSEIFGTLIAISLPGNHDHGSNAKPIDASDPHEKLASPNATPTLASNQPNGATEDDFANMIKFGNDVLIRCMLTSQHHAQRSAQRSQWQRIDRR